VIIVVLALIVGATFPGGLAVLALLLAFATRAFQSYQRSV
jgi:hypothetical protein